jgi:hypothetical protein
VLLPLPIVVLLVFFCLFCHLSIALGVNGAAALFASAAVSVCFRTVFVLLFLLMSPTVLRADVLIRQAEGSRHHMMTLDTVGPCRAGRHTY